MRRDASLIPLSHQHHNGLALCVLTDRSLVSDASPENVARLARRVVERYEIELINHFELEEQVLFPALASLPLVSTLLQEHRTIAAMVDGIRGAPSIEGLREFTSLLRRHIRTEEDDLFAEAQQRLPREKLDEIGHILEERAVRVRLDP